MSQRDYSEIAKDIVDGFFIGGKKDSLKQPNLTKDDLVHSISNLCHQVRQDTISECADVVEEGINQHNPYSTIAQYLKGKAMAIRALGVKP